MIVHEPLRLGPGQIIRNEVIEPCDCHPWIDGDLVVLEGGGIRDCRLIWNGPPPVFRRGHDLSLDGAHGMTIDELL